MSLCRVSAVTLLAWLLAVGLAGGALAQDRSGETRVAITGVDSADFPQVTAFVAVTGEGGLPLEGLEGHFSLWEDGQRVPAASVAVEKDATQAFSVVLALDVSTKLENLELVQEAVKLFLEGLGPQDQAALVAFYDEFQVVQDFTSSKRALNAAVNALGPQGDYTVLYQAVLEAAVMAGDPPAGRGVVVVFTDSADNVHNVPLEEAANQALELRVPVYTIGFGPKIQADDLQELADMTGGRAFVLAELDEMQGKLQEIGDVLRQGYRIVFQSGLQADDAGHDFAVQAAHQGQTGRAQGSFVARSGEVLVSLPNLAEGQRVGGVITLTAQVTATTPASIVSVQYLLDGEPLAEATEPPFAFQWDSLAEEPGARVLAARATDSAGNQGQVELGLEVILPVAVTLSELREPVELGERVTLEAQVQALAGVRQVEFLLDGEPLGSDGQAPFRFVLDSGVYLAGKHTLAARAIDVLGREQESSASIEFVAPPPPPEPEPETPGWLIVLASVVTIAVLCAAVAALVFLVRLQRKRYQIHYRLQIYNLGNVKSRYELRADEPSGALRFEFSLDGVRLNHHETPPVPVVAPEAQVSSSGQAVQAAPAANPHVSQGGAPGAGRGRGVGGALINLLATVGAVLPRSIGQPLLNLVSKTRQGQAQVRSVGRISSQAARVKSAAASSPSPAQAPAQAPSSAQAPARPSPPARGVAAPVATVAAVDQTDIHTWVRTPEVEPGESLMVDLLIDPVRLYQSRRYPIDLLSRSVEEPDAPLVIEEMGVQTARPSLAQRYYPFFVVFLVVVVTLALFGVFLVNAGVWV
jgi:VWFA-related protein